MGGILRLTSAAELLIDPCFAENVGFIGSPLKEKNRNTNNYGPVEKPEICQSFCQAVAGCGWFNWEAESGNCWLMRYKGRKLEIDNVVTGPSHCQPKDLCIERDTVYGEGTPLRRIKWNGTDVWTHNHGRKNTESDCRALCRRTRACDWFVWDSNSLCWLYTDQGDVEDMKDSFGVSSGPSVCEEDFIWSYKSGNKDDWTSFHPQCAGKQQSPINFNTGGENQTQQGEVVDWKPLVLSNYYEENSTYTLVNTGNSVKIKISGKSGTVYGGPFIGTYQLDQIHFHWGHNDQSGSEHTVDYNSFPLEMHLVHRSPDHKLAVLAFLFHVSDEDNLAMNPILSSLPDVTHAHSKTNITADSNFSVQSIIEKVVSGRYFSYSGSLTTPPCIEGVQWVVFLDFLKISSKQLSMLRTVRDADGVPMMNNFRPIQTSENRDIFVSDGNLVMKRDGTSISNAPYMSNSFDNE